MNTHDTLDEYVLDIDGVALDLPWFYDDDFVPIYSLVEHTNKDKLFFACIDLIEAELERGLASIRNGVVSFERMSVHSIYFRIQNHFDVPTKKLLRNFLTIYFEQK